MEPNKQLRDENKSTTITRVCPVCGLDLTAFPHTEEECMEWFAQDYLDEYQTRMDLLQF